MSDRDRDRGDRRDRDRDRDRDRERDRGHRRDRSRSRDRDRGRDKDRDRRRDRSRSKEKDNSPPPPPRRKKTTSNWDKDWSGNEVTAASALGDGKVPEILNALVHQAATQPSTKARRIHVGNLPTTGPVDTQTLGEFFDQAMAQAGFKNEVEGTCVKDVWISGEKKFAFIEIRTFEEAERAMGLDGVTLYGCPLRVARPHDYVPPPSAEALQNALAAAGSISSAEAVKIAAAAAMSNPNMLHHVDAAGRVVPTGVNKQITDAAMTALGLQPTAVGSQNMQTLLQASRKCRRVHIGNLPNIPPVTSQQLKEFVCEGMKQMQLCVKPGDPVVDSFVATDGKFGFVELRTVQEASNVLALSGCEYAGRALRISRPTDYQPPTMELVQKLEGTGILGIPGDAGVVLPVMGQGGEMGPDLSRATCVVALKNMMTEAEMNDDEEYKEIIEDTKGKCEEEYGPVSSILAARPGPSECPPDKIGQVFVRFPDRETAIKAAEGLHNLKFDGRIVEATFLDENEYEALRKHFPAQPQAEDDPKPAPIPPPPPAPAAPAESAPTEDAPPTEG